ncbi:hypothetical protein [Pseudomonas rhodesiae]|uniref:hypothetical protein n=1 Tax=Pseudomonas rhodesiae TaxID=76760 RepID=UPI0032B11684
MANKAAIYNIYLKPNPDVEADDIQEKMNLALNWFKYADNCWVVFTTSDQDKWYTRLKGFVDPSGYLFICKLEAAESQGWMTTAFWDWYQEHVSKIE